MNEFAIDLNKFVADHLNVGKVVTCKCAACNQPSTDEMVSLVGGSPSRGTNRECHTHESCFAKVWSEFEVDYLDPSWGVPNSNDVCLVMRLCIDKWNGYLHASLIDAAISKGKPRNAQWFWMGDNYRSPKYHNLKFHSIFPTIDKYCLTGKMEFSIFKEGVLVDEFDYEWDNNAAMLKHGKRTDIKLEVMSELKPRWDEAKNLVIPTEARSKKEITATHREMKAKAYRK